MIEKWKQSMNEYFVKSSQLPFLFVRDLLPTSFQLTPVHWGARDEAKALSYDRAIAVQQELSQNGIATELIQNGDLANGRTRTKLQ